MNKVKIQYLDFDVDAFDSEGLGLMLFPEQLPAPLVLPFVFSSEVANMSGEEVADAVDSPLKQLAEEMTGSPRYTAYSLNGDVVPKLACRHYPLIVRANDGESVLRLYLLRLEESGAAVYCYVPYTARLQAMDQYVDTHYPLGVYPCDDGSSISTLPSQPPPCLHYH